MPSCPCKDLIHEKGIVVGRKKNVDIAILEGINLYLQKYWMHYGFNNHFLSFFSTSIQVLFYLLLQGQIYRIENCMVIKPDVVVGGHP